MGYNGRLSQSTKRHNANINMAYGREKDNNTYCYRLVDGKPRFHRVILGPGWQDRPFDYTKLSCYEQKKGEESMVQGRVAKEKPSNEVLIRVAEKHNYSNLIKRVKDEFHVGEPTARKWLEEAELIKAKPQTPPEPEGDQPDPAQEDQKPADKSIPENEITVKDVLLYELEQSEKGDVHSEPRDYTVPRYEAPQRANLTRDQYEEMAGITEDRRSALRRYCEQQAFESLLQNWATDVFWHSALSREKKLEIIGMLLDLGVA